VSVPLVVIVSGRILAACPRCDGGVMEQYAFIRSFIHSFSHSVDYVEFLSICYVLLPVSSDGSYGISLFLLAEFGVRSSSWQKFTSYVKSAQLYYSTVKSNECFHHFIVLVFTHSLLSVFKCL